MNTERFDPDRVRALRKERRLKQYEVARKLGWPTSRLCRIEKGQQQPTATDLVALVEALEAPGVSSFFTSK